jgi:transposase
MEAYSMEFREAVAEAYQSSGSSDEVAEQFHCSGAWVRRLMQRERQTGSLAPRPPHRPDNNRLDDEDLALIARLVAQRPDIELAEVAAELQNRVSVPTVCRACQRLGLSRKKSRRTRRSRTGPT